MNTLFGFFDKGSRTRPTSTVTCATCQGKGWIPRPGCNAIAINTPGGAFREKCPACKGTGYAASPDSVR